jgi:hypothetical protein
VLGPSGTQALNLRETIWSQSLRMKYSRGPGALPSLTPACAHTHTGFKRGVCERGTWIRDCGSGALSRWLVCTESQTMQRMSCEG